MILLLSKWGGKKKAKLERSTVKTLPTMATDLDPDPAGEINDVY